MTTQEYKAITKHIKSLKAAYQAQRPSFEVMQKSSGKVMAYIQQTSGVADVSLRPARAYARYSIILGMFRSIVPPQFAYVTAVFALILSATAAGFMSRKALPGTSLYGTKMALEYTQARFVSNPSERARVQMDLAGRRLEEMRAITELSSKEPNGRVEQTLKQFTKEVKNAKNTLKQAGDPLQVEAATQELARKARQYEEELLKAKAGVKPGRDVGVAAIEEALKEVAETQ